jgi:hypothetical protein
MYVYVCTRDCVYIYICVCVCMLTSSFFLHRRSSRTARTIVPLHPMCGFGCVCLFGCVCVCVGDVVGGDEFGLDFVGGSGRVCVCVCVCV